MAFCGVSEKVKKNLFKCESYSTGIESILNGAACARSATVKRGARNSPSELITENSKIYFAAQISGKR